MQVVCKLLFFFMLSASALPAESSIENEKYRAKDYSYLLGMEGFSDTSLKIHFKLYEGYVANTNLLLEKIRGFGPGPEYSELRRRLGWEFDGMRLHELYFENLKSRGGLVKSDPLYQELERNFGSFDQWWKDFEATGAMRGIGWAVLYRDPVNGKLVNVWINEHDTGHFAGGKPILIMDVFEHAYLLDYGLNRSDYIKAFFKNINWDIVKKRAEKI